MSTSDFLAFAGSAGANVMTQSDYAALAAVATGFQSGTAKSAQVNKVLRQTSIIAAVIGQFIANNSGQNSVDDGTTATLLANLMTAVRSSVKQSTVLTDTGAVNAYAASNAAPLTSLPGSGFTQTVLIANANTGASTYAPDGLTAKPIYGLGMQPLQGGELITGGIAKLTYLPGANSGSGAWVLLECTGGAQQVAAGSAAGHAPNLGQFLASLSGSAYFKIPVMVSGVLRTLIVQWGNANFASSDGDSGTLNAFPISFPNTALMAVASDYGASGTGSQCFSFACGNYAALNMRVWAKNNGTYTNATGRYIAIGW